MDAAFGAGKPVSNRYKTVFAPHFLLTAASAQPNRKLVVLAWTVREPAGDANKPLAGDGEGGQAGVVQRPKVTVPTLGRPRRADRDGRE